MPAVPARTPDQVHPKVKDELDKELRKQRPLVGEFKPPQHPRATITGIVRTLGGSVTVTLDEQFCRVILPQKVAKHHRMVSCNSDWDLCIWDPVTGEIRCTGDN